jgi:hypothetical protein
MVKARTKTEPRAPFVMADVAVRAGSSRLVELPVGYLPPGTASSMPVMVIHGRQPGPTVWLSGAIHGDEVNGIDIVRRLVLALDAKSLAGTVLAVPIVNIFGVTAGDRYLPDRRDLNRSFPGSARGSLGARIAHIFFDNVVSRCDIGLDFHSGSAGRSNLPQIRCDLDQPETRRLALAFSAPVTMHATLRDGSLRAAARKRGTPVLLYETGEAHRFDETGIRLGVDGALRVLATLQMIPQRPEADGASILARSSTWVRAGRGGFVHLDVDLGDGVQAGQTLGRVTQTLGRARVPLRSREPGIVIGILRDALVHHGDAVVHVAQVSDESAGRDA